jgi:hypothetical protein
MVNWNIERIITGRRGIRELENYVGNIQPSPKLDRFIMRLRSKDSPTSS